MVKPYSDEEGTNHKIRTFLESVDEEELIWHRDRNDREIAVLEGSDWKLQKDNLLPVKLKKGMLYYIEAMEYHRLIKGNGTLKLKIWEKN